MSLSQSISKFIVFPSCQVYAHICTVEADAVFSSGCTTRLSCVRILLCCVNWDSKTSFCEFLPVNVCIVPRLPFLFLGTVISH